jgi:hypothetical protein
MLVDAFEQCPNTLLGTYTECPVFAASVDDDKAYHCHAQGEVVAEVRSSQWLIFKAEI